jgi:hypothetical protein
VTMQSQLTHTHAELEFCVMSDKQKFETITPLQAGASRVCIMQKIIAKSSDHDVGRSVIMPTIWHLDKKHVKQDIDTKVADSVNVYKLLIEKEDWRAFNLRLHYGQPPAYLSHKEVETGPNSVFMFSMSDNQQEVFCQNPRVLMMDSTHGTNRHGLLLLTGSVLDERGTNVDVFQAMISTENEDQVTSALKIMKSMEPEACSNVDTLTSDLNRAHVNSFKDVINPNVNFVACGWHVEKAWKKRLSSHCKPLLQAIRKLKLQPDVTKFHEKYDVLELKYMQGTAVEKKAGDYFATNYGRDGIKAVPKERARCYTAGSISHNLFPERYHRDYKSESERSDRIDEMMIRVGKYTLNRKYCRNQARSGQRGVPPERATRFKR